MVARKAVVSWSGGKDSAFALERIREAGRFEVVGLFTTVSADTERVFHHEVPKSLIATQAAALGVASCVVRVAPDASAGAYGDAMSAALGRLKEAGVDVMVFGDIHLRGVRRRRETKLCGTGLEPVFPLWGEDPAGLTKEMLLAGLRAKIVSVDTRFVRPASLGGRLDRAFLDALPKDADWCGERGEYHTFVEWSPSFCHAIETRIDTMTERPPFASAVLTDQQRVFE